jgi:plastocyanin
MWSRSSLSAALLLAVALPAFAGGEVAVTEERKQACAEAEERFKELFPDYKAEPGVAIVKVYKYNFCPVNMTVKAGTRVRWINLDKRTSHSVWMKQAGVEESERFFPDEMWEFTFDKSGDYPYLCGPHWEQQNMRGYVKVE